MASCDSCPLSPAATGTSVQVMVVFGGVTAENTVSPTRTVAMMVRALDGGTALRPATPLPVAVAVAPIVAVT